MTRRDDATQKLSDEQFERIAKALADPRRVALLGAIARGERHRCPMQGALQDPPAGGYEEFRQLCHDFPVSKATISHHVKQLKWAGLVRTRREGQVLHVNVRHDVLEAYAVELLERVRGTPATG
jgi:ArsR family transcriptional regulator, arsenate/arsenite/antimonite-responsive transcriptional repressor